MHVKGIKIRDEQQIYTTQMYRILIKTKIEIGDQLNYGK